MYLWTSEISYIRESFLGELRDVSVYFAGDCGGTRLFNTLESFHLG